MRKCFLTSMVLALCMMAGFGTANAQITVIEAPTEEVICMCAVGQQNLIRCVLKGDTTYAFQLCEKEGFVKVNEHTVKLGHYDQALAIMQSMVDYNGKNKDVVLLNNPSNNIAVVQKVFGQTMFYVTDVDGTWGNHIAQGYIKDMIRELKKERGQ